ncbi:MAG: CoA pyrophosphatase [Candidatus Eremiobacteraeota bacterium]|nr:CoA pyrophosphatase [Candidatus Eremiobacteraeota bacterium]
MQFALTTLVERLQYHRPRRLTLGRAHHAAVLVPLWGASDDLRLVCFERTPEVVHPGEICFPGGSIEPGDAGPVAAALRETHEEIGLPPQRVRVLGQLDDVETVVSNFIITPVVGYVADLPELRPDALEVARIMSIPVALLARPGVESARWQEYRGVGKLRYAYEFDGHRIWGATGRILRSLLDVWRSELQSA